jgi:hypothetical protein
MAVAHLPATRLMTMLLSAVSIVVQPVDDAHSALSEAHEKRTKTPTTLFVTVWSG